MAVIPKGGAGGNIGCSVEVTLINSTGIASTTDVEQLENIVLKHKKNRAA